MLELELASLKIQQHQEKDAKEHTQMQLYAEQVSQLMTTEKNLRLQLAADGERFQQFQVREFRQYAFLLVPDSHSMLDKGVVEHKEAFCVAGWVRS
jgi:hypothetical protein